MDTRLNMNPNVPDKISEERDELIRRLVQSVAVHSVNRNTVLSTFRYQVPTPAPYSIPLMITVIHKTVTTRPPSASKIQQISDQINQGFVVLSKYVLDSAVQVNKPIYGLDLETGDVDHIEAFTIAIDRGKLHFPHVRRNPDGDPVLFLDFANKKEEV